MICALHGADNFLVVDNIDTGPAMKNAPAQIVSDQMRAAWSAFARNGDPNTKNAAHWPADFSGSRTAWLFNANSRPVNDFGQAAREFWERA